MAAEEAARGSFEQVPLAHLLIRALDAKFTGTLDIEPPDGGPQQLRLLGGLVAGVAVPDEYARLGELLVTAGALLEAELELALQKEGLLGQALIAEGHIDDATLKRALVLQVLRRAERLFGLPGDSSWVLTKNADLEEQLEHEPVRIDTPRLLWTGIHEYGEHGDLIESTMAALGDARLRIRRGAKLQRFGLSGAALTLATMLSSRSLTVDELLVTGAGDPDLVHRLLYVLTITRFIERRAGEVEVVADTTEVARVKLRRVAVRRKRAVAAVEAVKPVERHDPRSADTSPPPPAAETPPPSHAVLDPNDELDQQFEGALDALTPSESAAVAEVPADAGYAPPDDASAYDQGGYDDAAYDQGAYDDSGYDQGAYDDSGSDHQGYDESAPEQQGYDESAYDQRAYEESANAEQAAEEAQRPADPDASDDWLFLDGEDELSEDDMAALGAPPDSHDDWMFLARDDGGPKAPDSAAVADEEDLREEELRALEEAEHVDLDEAPADDELEASGERSIEQPRTQGAKEGEADEPEAPTSHETAVAPAEASAESLHEQALYELSQQRVEAALELCQRACAAEPNNWDYLASSVGIRAALPRPDLKVLLLDLDFIVREDGEHVAARYYRGLLRRRMGLDDGARQDFLRVLELEPDHPAAKAAIATLDSRAAGT
jgi:hypothetical protein